MKFETLTIHKGNQITDKNCPVVFGASARVATPYEDPKAFDDTPEESAMYEARSKQIALETLYVFSLVK